MEERNLRKIMVGTVTSDKMDKTVVVSVATSVSHKTYGKTVKRTYKLKAHDENNSCEIGDKVKVMETRPLSKARGGREFEILEMEGNKALINYQKNLKVQKKTVAKKLIFATAGPYYKSPSHLTRKKIIMPRSASKKKKQDYT